MTENNTLNTLQERYDKLPLSIKEVLDHGDYKQRCELVANLHKLGEENQTAFQNEITLVLLGFTPISELPASLAFEFGMHQEDATPIVEDVYELILTEDAISDLKEFEKNLNELPTENEAASLPKKTEEISSESTQPESLPSETPEQPGATLGLGATTQETPPPIPSYKKPLTDLPRYDERQMDPYKESSAEEGEGDDKGDARW